VNNQLKRTRREETMTYFETM